MSAAQEFNLQDEPSGGHEKLRGKEGTRVPVCVFTLHVHL